MHYPNPDGSGPIEGYLVGTGTVGLVFTHQLGSDLCEWKAQADRYAGLGYQALAITLGGEYDQAVLGAVAQLRKHGATRIVLVGASMGGTSVLVAASEAQPPVQAVVSLSGPAQYADMDASAAVAKLRIPVYFFAGHDDTSFAQDAQTLFSETTETAKQLLIVDNTAFHGSALLPLLGDRIDKFIKEHAG